MQVKKRNGSIVPFDSEFIVRAISLAAAAAGEHSDEAIRGAVDAIVEKLAALANYSTITKEMVSRLGTVTLDADTFDMVKLLTSGQADKAQQKLKTLLALQNEPIMITGALIGNYIDMYRVLQAKRSRRSLADVAKDFGYGGKWSYRLGETERTASRFKRRQLEKCLEVLQKLDTDLKSSKLDADLLMQKALCELALAGRS